MPDDALTPARRKAPGSRGKQGRAGRPPVGRRFKPGQSGNPSGLSAERRAFLSEVRKEEEPHTKLVLAKLRALALEGIQWATIDYLDRLGVRMPDKLELSGEDGAPLPMAVVNPLDPTTMTSEEVRKKLAVVRAERDRILAGNGAAKNGVGSS
jgi:hypothetical protein